MERNVEDPTQRHAEKPSEYASAGSPMTVEAENTGAAKENPKAMGPSARPAM